jgi:Amt family ammonium transporter
MKMNIIMRKTGLAGLFGGPALLAAGPALAQEGLDKGDTAWMLTATVIVLMMTIPGLALFYGGMVRKKHVLAMAMQSFAAACLVTVVWMIVGYSLAFGDGGGAQGFIGGLDNFFLASLGADSMSGTIPESVFMTFQMTFAIITPALVTGSLADRMKFSTMLVFIAVWLVVVYAPITHWVWGGGFLGDAGVLDFAGGTVVHINAGVTGLVAALIVGKRHNYGSEYMAPHNLVYSIIGASLLWVGWFGFNAGSALAADNVAGMAMAVTQISAAAAGLSWMVVEWAVRGKPSVLGIVSGVVGGLVAITPAAGFVAPTGALVIGLVAGAVCFWGATWLKNKLGYDDSLDCFGVHGIGGIVGAVLTGVFAVEAIGGTPGMMEGNAGQVWIQIEGIAATILWSGAATAVILFILKATMGLRVDTEAEIEGLDLALHGETVQ